MVHKDIFVYSGSANPELSKAIAHYLGTSLAGVDINRFPDGEIFVQYHDNIRRADVYLIQPTSPPANEHLMELLIMIDAAKRASAARVTAVMPFFGYARQDRKDKPRVPITAKLVANLLTVAGANRILAMDLHSQQIQGFFDIPVDHLYAAPVMIPYLKEKVGNSAVVVAPDSGSVKLAHAYSDMLNAGLAVVAKRRVNAHEVESSHLVGDVKGRICVVTDDLTTTAGTLVGAAELLLREGAKEVYAVVSHCLLSEKGKEKIMKGSIKELITTNGIPIQDDCNGRIKVLNVAPLLGEAIKRIHGGESVSSLFRIK
ncbi:MAG: ribose-phosphate pyrophosphokinase [Lentisphaerae bacterium GWF2_52_8]|nr:MAG: ribose-phosphate pyrophosphokinase [Lentisphaerae bacterium GWF2_52_8]